MLILIQEEYEAILKNRENSDAGLTWKEYKSMTYTHHVSLHIVNIYIYTYIFLLFSCYIGLILMV